MKRPALITIGTAAALLVGVCLVLFIPVREPVSLTFLQYEPWPAAKLKLTNNSRKTITYVTDRADAPVLCRLKTSAGWTNTSRQVLGGTWRNAATGKTNQIFASADPAPGIGISNLKLLERRELEPGQSAELYIILEPDGPPVRAGTVCIVPQGKLAQRFGQWIGNIKKWCHLKSNPPGQIEIWCKEPLQISLKPTNAEKR